MLARAVGVGVVAALIGQALPGCGSDTESVDASVCKSGTRWTGGNDESPNMNPGKACIDCHSSGEGPRFTIAGTVFPDRHAQDLCFGSAATVTITGADGRVITLSTNEAGNFYTRDAVAMPYTAKVTINGTELKMAGQQSNGDCNACHTQNGASDAPGRISLP